MGLEQTTVSPPQDLEELERVFKQREEKLPGSIGKYIRNLKSAGKWEQAMSVGEQIRTRKAQTRQRKAEDELKRTIHRILRTDDLHLQAEQESRAIWLLEKAGLILPEERTRELVEILDSQAPDLRGHLQKKLPEIRDEMKKL